MSTKILCVDDDPHVLAGYQRGLRKQFTLDTALGGEAGLELLWHEGPFAVVVADMNMPGMNGIEFLQQAREVSPDTVRFMLTGNAEQSTAVEAVNQGHVFQFLTKPCSPEVLARALERGVSQYRLITAERDLLERTLNGSIQVLMDVLAMVAPQEFGVSQKLREHMRIFARSIKVEQTWELEIAAMLAPIGCVTLPPEVLRKHARGIPLSGAELDMIERVPLTGSNLLAHIPRLGAVADIVLHQNKCWDGSGYPVGQRAGEDLPLGARILKVLLDLLHLESQGLSRSQALDQMTTRRGWYDPRVLSVAMECFGARPTPPTEAGSRPVTLRELHLGHVLAAPVESLDGMILAGTGTEITEMVLEKLHNFETLSGLRLPLQIHAAKLPA